MLSPLLVLLAGCAHPVYTEKDDGEIREISRGTEFSISLPRTDSKPVPDPLIQGAFIIVTGRSTDEGAGRDTIELRAEGTGEADIRIPGFRPGQESPGGDYLLRVRVKGGNDPGIRSKEHSKPSYP